MLVPPNETVIDTLEWYNSNYNIAIVSVEKNFGDGRPENMFDKVWMASRKDFPLGRREVPIGHEKVIAIGRDVDKLQLMVSMGGLKGRNKGTKLDCRYLKIPTCKINKVHW